MNAETIQDFLKRRPFEAFEVLTTAGERHAVRHPETAMLGKGHLVIVPRDTDRVIVVSLLHIAEVHVLQAA